MRVKSSKINFDFVMRSMHLRPISKSRFSIPLCHLKTLVVGHPILEVYVHLLENEVVNGHKEGDRVLYVSIMDNEGN